MSASGVAVPAATPLRVLIWLRPDQLAFVQGLVEAINHTLPLSITAVGTTESWDAQELAKALGCSRAVTDLRATLAPELRSDDARSFDVILLASPGPLGCGVPEEDQGDAEMLALLKHRGVPVLSFEPLAGSLVQWHTLMAADAATNLPTDDLPPGLVIGPLGGGSAGSGGSGGLGSTTAADSSSVAVVGERWHVLAMSRLGKAMRDAQEVISQLGSLRLVSVQAFSGPAQGSLGARVYDALDVVTSLLGLPDQVHAVHVPPVAGRGTLGETAASRREFLLVDLLGDISINMRFPDGRSGVVVASNCAGRFSRTITLVGEKGRVRIFDDGLEWIGTDGTLIDASRDAARIRGSGESDHAAAAAIRVFADRFTRLLDPRLPPPRPVSAQAVLATAGAALLSARTGEAESPETMLRMV